MLSVSKTPKWSNAMWKTRILLSCFVVGLCQCGSASAYDQPSEAVLWMQRTDIEKAGYIDGLCDAYKHITPEGELFCKPLTLDYKGIQVRRFCTARWVFKNGLAGGADPMPGIRMFNQFYADKDHSELPTWMVLAAYNDKACGENRALSRLVPMQAKLLCLRQLGGMRMNRYPAKVVAAQEAACNAMK
jgi:hypothetical protein